MRCIVCGKRIGYKLTFEDLLVMHQQVHMSCYKQMIRTNHMVHFHIGDALIKHVFCNGTKNLLFDEERVCIYYGYQVYESIIKGSKESVILFLEEHEFVKMNPIIWRLVFPLSKKQIILCSVDQYHIG